MSEVLTAYERLVLTFIEWAHPSWLTPYEPLIHALRKEVHAGKLAHAIMHTRADHPADSVMRVGLDPAELELAWVGPDDIAILCLLRALFHRRTEIRRLIDKRSLLHLQSLAPMQVVDYLREIPGATELSTQMDDRSMDPLIAMQRNALQWEGMCLLLREHQRSIGLASLWRFNFDRALSIPVWIARLTGPAEREGGQRFAEIAISLRGLMKC
ncbi:type III secretion protein HrpB4 [Caballeronia calidae]|uniref:type III secretion protein HrpB4 n=1 Tax=Caballeronia calidae TaxID=1777139 RepID=UPI00078852F0|nr:type III secretion protein HrpB4 [Caballeronia calidae]